MPSPLDPSFLLRAFVSLEEQFLEDQRHWSIFSQGCLLPLGQNDVLMGLLGLCRKRWAPGLPCPQQQWGDGDGNLWQLTLLLEVTSITSTSETQPLGTRNYVKTPNSRIQLEMTAWSFCSSLLFACVCLYVSVSKALWACHLPLWGDYAQRFRSKAQFYRSTVELPLSHKASPSLWSLHFSWSDRCSTFCFKCFYTVFPQKGLTEV